MDPLTAILGAVTVFNQAAPALTGLILSFRHEDGTVAPLITLDEAQKTNDENIAFATKWLEEHKDA